VIARLKDGVSLQRAAVEKDRHCGPARGAVSGRRLAIVLMGAVAAVLLIARANVANLLLAKAGGRQRDRQFVLPGRRRKSIIGQMLTESTLLALLGARPDSCWRTPRCTGCSPWLPRIRRAWTWWN